MTALYTQAVLDYSAAAITRRRATTLQVRLPKGAPEPPAEHRCWPGAADFQPGHAAAGRVGKLRTYLDMRCRATPSRARLLAATLLRTGEAGDAL